MTDCCEYAELRRRAEDAEFDLATMQRVQDRLLKKLDDLRAESRSTESVLKSRADGLRRAMRQALKHLDNEKWNHLAAVLLRALGDLPPPGLAAEKEHTHAED